MVIHAGWVWPGMHRHVQICLSLPEVNLDVEGVVLSH